MADIHIRVEGCAGRITLTRPQALNALSYEMCLAIDSALIDWAQDNTVSLVMIDAEGTKAFCAGGDIAQMYATGMAGDYCYGRKFWADEYRMNARIAEYPKPIVSFLQGFTMGGGVGVGCHASHRIVGETSQIAMPECGIGLVPDVGGSWILARAPGALGVYLGLTGARMGPGDSMRAGFADMFIPQDHWEGRKAQLVATGDVSVLEAAPAPQATLAAHKDEIDAAFASESLPAIAQAIAQIDSAFAAKALQALQRNSPLAMACAIAMLKRLGRQSSMREALAQEYRFTWRAMEHADFLEGIRAAIIDKDRSPRWRHATLADVTKAEVGAMLTTLGPDELTFDISEEGKT